MVQKLACRDVGTNCDYVASGETEEELLVDINKHGKEVHGLTEEYMNGPELVKKIKAAIKKE